MFKWYGLLGAILVILVEVNFFLKIQPYANWYFPIIWFGYILVVDALIYRIKGRSLISNNFKMFLGMFIFMTLLGSILVSKLGKFKLN